MFQVTDDEYAFYKTQIREMAGKFGKSERTKEIAKDFSLYLLDFMEHDDRAIGLLVGVALEEATRELLASYLIDDKESKKLLQRGGSLDSHSARIRLAYALGLIPEWIRDELVVLRDIRNECAHERARFFSKRPLSSLIDRLNVGQALDRAIEEGTVQKTTIAIDRHAKFFISAGLVWVRLRVWSGVVADDFRCVPLAEMKRTAFLKARSRRNP
jgi:DNA-binding MltR family transcriptional regulator